MGVIRTENLTFKYSEGMPDEVTAIKNINVDIEQGDFVGIIGSTGSGKSTFIQQLNGLLKPTEGKVYIDGEDIWAPGTNRREVRFKVGLVFQYPEYQLFEDTVYKDIAYGPSNLGVEGDELDKRVRSAASFVGISDEMLQRSPFELSGGEKRRVALAGVISMQPRVLVLDEPASGLDPQRRLEILGEIKNYHKQSNTTVLLVSHSMEDIARYADKIMVFHDAELVLFDTVKEVFSRAEELGRIGLALPQITSVFSRLRREGFEKLPQDVYTVQYAAEMILEKLGMEASK